jgi:GMP synthase-like glutamine amidotransferase
MKVGILEIGGPPEDLRLHYPRYGEMAAAMLGDAHACQIFEIPRGDAPVRPDEFDVYVVTDSEPEVTITDPLWWIPAMRNFIAAAKHEAIIIGLGFGHVLMADAFHGRTALASDGWTLGLQSYQVEDQRIFLDDCNHISAPAFHRSRVTSAPLGARVLLRSASDPLAAFWYESHPALSFHCAPEMPFDYVRALITRARDQVVDAEGAERSLLSFGRATDGARVADWINRFIDFNGPGTAL